MTEAAGQTYQVRGMSCGHCVAAVQREVGGLEGVRSVEVDLAQGRVVVVGAGVPGEAVVAAVQNAGFSVVGR